jgi:uncharacterized protein (TIGR03382 family)
MNRERGSGSLRQMRAISLVRGKARTLQTSLACERREAMMKTIQLTLLALATGCGPEISLTDNIDLTWDFGPTFASFDSSLHTPYVKGAPVTLYVDSSDKNESLAGWTVESSDPSVFRIDDVGIDDSGHSVAAKAVAVGVGTADLAVFDAGHHHQGSGHAEVLAPDHIELDAHAYLIMGMDDQAPVDEARILEAGQGTYLVRYFNGSQELHGNGVLAVNAPAAITAQPETTFLFENREWLSLTASTPGTTSIELLADGASLGMFPVVTVPETDIASVVMLSQSEKGHKNGDWLVALAQSFDGQSRRIFGVDYTWDVDGIEQTAEGDLYRYEYKSGDYQHLHAARNGMGDSTDIQSDGGYVDSSNNIGCAATGGAGPLVVLAALGLVRRRRR